MGVESGLAGYSSSGRSLVQTQETPFPFPKAWRPLEGRNGWVSETASSQGFA